LPHCRIMNTICTELCTGVLSASVELAYSTPAVQFRDLACFYDH
jgi:hypothetical protein